MKKERHTPDLKARRVIAHTRRRCPHCDSDKWHWEGAVPTTPEEISRYLLVRYRCQKCGGEFLVEEAKRSRVVRSAEECAHCHSRSVEKCSREGADIELWRCRKCNAYMAIGSD
jgi:transposase-like protein